MTRRQLEEPASPPTEEGQWASFERWQRAFLREARTAQRCESGLGALPGHARFLAWPGEVEMDLDRFIERAKEKTNFLSGYLVDLSFDGAEAMARRSALLAKQLPEACEDAISVWLEQDLDREPLEAGSYFAFQGSCVRLFCADIQDIDFGSARAVLPYDRMLIELPRARRWTIREANQAIKHIVKDLEFDAYYCRTKATGKTSQSLDIEFHWE